MIEEIIIQYNGHAFTGHIYSVSKPKSWIIFALGSGSSYKSIRNNSVAQELALAGHATLLFDLLTVDEDQHNDSRFNIPLLGQRLLSATQWLMNSKYYIKKTPLAYFGASTGAAAALTAIAHAPKDTPFFSVISHGGRPDLVDENILSTIQVPTLLIIGGEDHEVIKLNEYAAQYIPYCEITVVPGATHLFEELGALEQVTKLSIKWLDYYYSTGRRRGNLTSNWGFSERELY